ncbi:MAG: ribonuclease H-like domain-containing protein [Pirellulales bacterium]
MTAKAKAQRAAQKLAMKSASPEAPTPLKASPPLVTSPSLDTSPSRRPEAAPRNGESAEALEDLVPGVIVESAAGCHYRVVQRLDELWLASSERVAEFSHRLAGESAETGDGESGQPGSRQFRYWQRDTSAFREHFCHRTLFLDLETCGFSGSPLFLIGVVRSEGESLVVDQLLARNYAEERAVLSTLWQLAAENRVLVTFNGKSFDWPMVHDRSTYHRLGRRRRPESASTEASPSPLGPQDTRPHLAHIDVLHHARRRWRGRLPNCKLQTLERYVCRRTRDGDIPGSQVPTAYHEFVRTGDAWQLRSILEHNAQDLVTLVELSMTLFGPPRPRTDER